jgi:hypothetical protein
MADRAAFLAGSPSRIVIETIIGASARGADDDAARAEIARLTTLYEQASGAVASRQPMEHAMAATPAFAR